jgi:hypothetical protein
MKIRLFLFLIAVPMFAPTEPYPPLATVIYAPVPSTIRAGAGFACTPVAVWDGDGPIWCAEGPKVRIAGVAAPELDGSCKSYHPCPTISGVESRDRLVKLFGGARGRRPEGHIIVRSAPMTCISDGPAGRSRTAAWCISPAFGDLSCAVVRARGAFRWSRYWKNHQC